MDFDGLLASTQFLDCSGRVTHTLTLLLDGNVEVVTGSVVAVVDPVGKIVLRPPGVRLPDQVLDQAAVLARDGLG